MCNVELLDEIKFCFDLKNDAKLASFLGVSRTAIHRIRFESVKLGFLPRLKIMDHIAFLGMRGWASLITTDELERKIHQYAHNLNNMTLGGFAEESFIDVVKRAFSFQSDDELASFLGMQRHSISTIRAGRSNLGHKPRLRILNRIEPFDLPKVENVLASSDALITAIRAWKQGSTTKF